MGTVSEYNARQEPVARRRLEGIAARVRELVPGVEEGTGYGMAAFRYRERPLLAAVATKAGYSVFPFSADVVSAAVAERPALDATKGGIRFTEPHPLPGDVLDRLLLLRRDEIDAALGA